MNRRFLFALLLIGATISIAFVLWFLFFRKPTTNQPIVQQPNQQNVEPSRPFDPSQNVPTFEPPTGQAPDPESAEEKERQEQERVKRSAMAIAARLGTFSSDDQFEAIRESYTIASSDFKEKLIQLREQMLKEHTAGSGWYQSVTPVTSQIERGSLPSIGRDVLTVTVTGQRIINNNKDYVSVLLTLQRNGANFIVTNAQFTKITQ